MGQGCRKPFYKNGVCEGTLQVTPLGDRTEIFLSCHDDKTGIYKGILYGTDGSIPLGTLLPKSETESMTLRRIFPNTQIEKIGEIQRGEAVLSYAAGQSRDELPGWESESMPERLFRDPVLAEAAKKQKQAWIRKEHDKVLLALPFWQKEFPMLPLFCFAQVQSLAGKLYAVFTLDTGGNPVLRCCETKKEMEQGA
jgi:hypothetical protein